MNGASPIWHPFTQHGLGMQEICIDHARGASLFTVAGQEIIDGISSWWVNVHGHNHPRLVAAVQVQAQKLDQVIFAGFTHAPAENLAEKLLRIAPPEFTRVFFSDSGSTAVEVALKMSVGYWHHCGAPRTKIIALEHGYHGDTFGGMAASARGLFTKGYEPMLFEVLRLPFPQGNGANTVEALQNILAREKNTIAALMVEPLLLGAGGMLIYAPATLKALATICRQHHIHFIADEVLTGWGRTGTLFACEQAGVVPDMLCLSKGITGGFLPLGATLAREEIYQAFYGADRATMFFHSSSFMANPLACAAACAALEIWQEEPVMERIAAIAAFHQQALPQLQKRDDVAHARQIGPIAAFEIKVEDGGYLCAIAPDFTRACLAQGVLLRPLGNTVYIMPPYCISTAQLTRIYDSIAHALDTLRNHSRHAA